MKADRASAVMRTLNPGEVKPKGIDCSHYDRKICVVRRHVYVPAMKPTFAVQRLGDRWLTVAPSEQTFARTFDRLELRAVDVMQLPAAAASLLPAVPPNRRASELEAAPVAPA